MYYPFFFYSMGIIHRPVFSELKGDPLIADLSADSPLLQGVDARDQEVLEQILQEMMGSRYQWGVSPYLEERTTLLTDCPQMVGD
jgi:hypothetical protein